MKAIKKACSGTSLYPKSSSVSSKLKSGGKIKKAQTGKNIEVEKDEPTLSNDSIRPLSSQYRLPDNNKMIIKSRISNIEKNNQQSEKKSTATPKKKTGGKVTKAKDGKWIQKAVNPKHKGYCTPMTKATCTPKRKALAKTFKKMARERKGK